MRLSIDDSFVPAGPYPGTHTLERIRTAAIDSSYVSMGGRRTASVHEFYRYPGRFAPGFAREVIRAFTRPGDLVLDPFMGGGTSLVEARLMGRCAFGSDLNALAHFVTQAKTATQTGADANDIRHWAASLEHRLRLTNKADVDASWLDGGYLRGLNSRSTWRLRNAIALALSNLARLDSASQLLLARCAILRTAQWALDMRTEIPGVASFRQQLISNLINMSAASVRYSERVRSATPDAACHHQALSIVQAGLPGLADAPESQANRPTLILMSPPYPGVYVLYHRWKLQGRKEISAPFWIAGSRDGQGMAHYTMAARSQPGLNGYFERLQLAMSDLARMTPQGTWLVQVVGFSDAETQLPRYLSVMRDTGFRECRFEPLANGPDGRLWREVPSRRWWVTAASRQDVARASGTEVVLVHQRSA